MPPTRSAPGVDRRTLLRNAALLGISVPTLDALLAACADAPTGSGGTRRRCERRRAADRLARQPGHVGHRRRQPADRRRAPARGRAAAALQLRRLHRAGGGEVVRGAVRRRGEDLHLQRHRRGDHQDPHRGGPVRPLLPELRPDRPAGDGQARAADQPQLSSATSATSGTSSRARGTTARRATPCPTASTRPGWAGATTRCPTTSPASPTPTTRCGTRRTPARSGSSTTGTPRWRWSGCGPASPT